VTNEGEDGQIKFSPYDRYLIVDYDLTVFSDRSRDVAMATNFRGKIGEISLLTFTRRLGIPKRIGIPQF